MYSASNEFKSLIKNNARYIKAYFLYSGVKYDIRLANIDDNIYVEDKFIGTFLAKNGSITTNKKDNLELENKSIDLFIGMQLSNQVEYVPMGTYTVYEVTNSNEFKIIDFRYKFNVLFDKSKVGYPTTALELLKEACSQSGVPLGTMDFPNKDLIITKELFFGYEATCANVVEAVAQASCTFAKISRSNKLELKWFSNVDFSLDLNHQRKLPLVTDKFGPINTVVLAREPQNDNVYWPPEVIGDRTEFKISNNPILDIDRYNSILPVYDRMNGFEYTPFNTESQGYFHLDCGDIIRLQKEDLSYINVYIMNHSIKFSGGVNSVFETLALTKTQINYSIASSIESKIYKAELEVDKVNGKIDALTEYTETKIEQVTNSLNISLSANLPLNQIYETATHLFTPDYTKQNLVITATSTLLDGTIVTSRATYVWKRKTKSAETALISGEVANKNILTVSKNVLSNDKTLDYICYVTLDGREAKTSVSLALTVHGEDGIDGKDAILVNIDSSNGYMFKNNLISTTLTVSIIVGDKLIDNGEKLTEHFGPFAYLQWQIKLFGETEFVDIPLTDIRLSDNGFIFTLSANDVETKAVFNCELNY